MYLQELRKFRSNDINDNQLTEIRNLASKARRDTLKMITFSGSGHPGGALSSIDVFTILWICSNTEANMAENILG